MSPCSLAELTSGYHFGKAKYRAGDLIYLGEDDDARELGMRVGGQSVRLWGSFICSPISHYLVDSLRSLRLRAAIFICELVRTHFGDTMCTRIVPVGVSTS